MKKLALTLAFISIYFIGYSQSSNLYIPNLDEPEPKRKNA